MNIIQILLNIFTNIRSIYLTFLNIFSKRETKLYPEEKTYLPPRYRGRIILTRDPDGKERCVACNLCAVVCPVDCISLQKSETPDGRWYPEFFKLIFLDVFFAAYVKKHVRLPLFN